MRYNIHQISRSVVCLAGFFAGLTGNPVIYLSYSVFAICFVKFSVELEYRDE